MDKRKGRKHSLEVRMRAFSIWQKLGENPWAKAKKEKGGKKSGSFYKGAFDSIPFLNDDAKRTFVHLLLRPGYMIRDYIKGEHDKYLAPLTALIIFYAFFALLSSVLQPIQQDRRLPIDSPQLDSLSLIITLGDDSDSPAGKDTINTEHLIQKVTKIVQKGYIYLHLDQYPEEVHTQSQASLAALENALRSQGIPLFLGDFIFLWLAMSMVLRRQKISMSACAAASAYVLCQFSFIMIFALLLTLGKSTSVSVGVMMLLLIVDYRQWLNLSWKKSFWRTVWTGVLHAFWYGLLILMISIAVLIIAIFK